MSLPCNYLGIVTQGSLSQGLEIRLDRETSVEDLRVGRFVTIEGTTTRMFGMLTDVSLGFANQSILLNPPPDDQFLRSVLTGTTTFGQGKVQPMLMMEGSANSHARQLMPVKTIPSHFSKVYEASKDDFSLVFGAEDENDPENNYFNIGRPLNMETPVCINLDKFVERSNGIFGKSGTGKSFLTRIFLCGIAKNDLASMLVFDMHNEYGWQAISENKGQPTVKGLKQLFGNRVVVFSLDPESSQVRGVPDAHELLIGYNQIEVEDLELLKGELNLSEATLENAYIVKERLGPDWISALSDMSSDEIDDFVENYKGHPTAIKTLQRRLNTIIQKTKYLKPRVSHNSVDTILAYIQAGKHVVLEFGRQNNLLSYMLATNVITRRIHREYVKQSEKHSADPTNVSPPRKLVIVIEEAHRFLAPAVARQTIFGIIAREMRKYFVTLLVVDQRPSGIDPEVISQIGTRVTSLLNDDKDIEAVFTGVSGSQTLRTVLAQMDPKQQALVLGYAVPMPVVVRTRPFDHDFYSSISTYDSTPAGTKQRAEKAAREVFG